MRITLKGGSSGWIHQTFAHMKAFGWQDGYGGFSVSKSNLPETISYIANQRQHHRGRTFQEEYLALLQKHEIEYDSKYLWD
ncbi:MAG: transposase [Limisphaerales bacterium]